VTLTLKSSVVKEEVGSNQDGLVNICYVFKATEVEVKPENPSQNGGLRLK
jgi:hypothetical protein